MIDGEKTKVYHPIFFLIILTIALVVGVFFVRQERVFIYIAVATGVVALVGYLNTVKVTFNSITGRSANLIRTTIKKDDIDTIHSARSAFSDSWGIWHAEVWAKDGRRVKISRSQGWGGHNDSQIREMLEMIGL